MNGRIGFGTHLPMRRLAELCVMICLGLIAHPGSHAAPMGNAIISTAEVMGKGELFEDLSIVTPLDGDGRSEIFMNSQYGIGFDTDIGFDIPLEGANRALFSATHMAWSSDDTRIRLGALALGSGGDEAAEIVLGHDIGDTTVHAGVAHAFPGITLFGGVTHTLTPSAMLHLEYAGGPDATAALGCEWTFDHGLGLIVSGLHDFDSNASLYIDVIWTNAD
jgi:hypothetical protein